MTAYSYPSDMFPAFPSVAVETPENWTGLLVPNTVLAVGRVTEPGQFRPNVIVAISRFAEGYTLQTAVDATVEKFAGLEGAVEIGKDVSTINGHEWAHIEASFIDPRVGTLVQAAHLAVVATGQVVDLVQVTGTVTAAQAKENLHEEIRAIQRSVVLGR
ncbi:MAG: hypothetical protein BGO97_11260 [Micrococcales bacterium 70-64]|jgi:hypothetical protein|nr:hypothetical protein [Leifsonia sp.]ODU64550.1 MAG: hypothetical protein ABT06_11265 [Leifsonia sp. SCN 70-46]OJX86242.1 MAG: hypothetical protein BGO97_11260 [Micrococcales bacterium 70-64]